MNLTNGRDQIAITGYEHGHVVLVLIGSYEHLCCNINIGHFLVVGCPNVTTTVAFYGIFLVVTV